MELICSHCKTPFKKKNKEYNRLVRNNQRNFYCNHKCASDSKKSGIECIRECLWCRKQFVSTTHKKYKKCCSTDCARKYSQSKVNTRNISVALKKMYETGTLIAPNKKKEEYWLCCKYCGKTFSSRKKTIKTCSRECAKKGMSVGGKTSASAQKRRSKNEILFYEMCKKTYPDAICNEPIFNGWDADVIIPSKKIAILWNGVWHRKKITHAHSLSQVKNRYRINIK